MHAGVEQNVVVVHRHEPRARANVRVGIQVGDVHRKSLTTDGHGLPRRSETKAGWTQIIEMGKHETINIQRRTSIDPSISRLLDVGC
jgi:hypothetical protein